MTNEFPISSLFFALAEPFVELDILVDSVVLEASSITWKIGGLFAKVTHHDSLFEVSMGADRLDREMHNQVCETEFEAYTIVITWLKEQQ